MKVIRDNCIHRPWTVPRRTVPGTKTRGGQALDKGACTQVLGEEACSPQYFPAPVVEAAHIVAVGERPHHLSRRGTGGEGGGIG